MPTALIVTAHPNADSFGAALAQAVADGAQEAGFSHVARADLYAERFQPIMSPEDMAQYGGAAPPRDVAEQMARVEAADLLVFVFPVWWGTVPAMMKGWFDRVLRRDWAWCEAGGPVALAGKRVLMLATTAETAPGFAATGAEQALHQQLIDGLWGFCGLSEAASLHIFHEVHGGTPRARLQAHLDQARAMAGLSFQSVKPV